VFVRNVLPSVQKKLFDTPRRHGPIDYCLIIYSASKTSKVILILSLLSLINFHIHVLSSDFLNKVIYFVGRVA
jgi:hypothetical protein